MKKKKRTRKAPAERKSKAGRPAHPPLPDDVVKILEEEFHIDSTVSDACHRAKITKEDYYREIANNTVFAHRMRKAQLYVDRQARGAVVNAIANKRNWKASIDWLKLRNRRYKTREVQEHTGKIIVQMGQFPPKHPFFQPEVDPEEKK